MARHKRPGTPQRMTPRARAYMSIAACRHLLVGLFCALRPQDFTSPSYDVIKNLVNVVSGNQMLIIWGVWFLAVGVVSAYAAVTGREEIARVALRGSVTSTAIWAGGFLAGIIVGTSGGWTGVIVWTALAAKDLTMLRDPLRNPFEDMLEDGDLATGR